jgi:hypothetical protein
MPSLISPGYNGRLLIYDIDEALCRFVSESLRDRGYSCHAVSTASDCIRQIDPQGTQMLFIGRAEEGLTLFDVIGAAQTRGVEVHTFDASRFDANEGGPICIVREIENKIIVSQHKPIKSA